MRPKRNGMYLQTMTSGRGNYSEQEAIQNICMEKNYNPYERTVKLVGISTIVPLLQPTHVTITMCIYT